MIIQYDYIPTWLFGYDYNVYMTIWLHDYYSYDYITQRYIWGKPMGFYMYTNGVLGYHNGVFGDVYYFWR
jgi:hypothetical protein